MVRATLGTEPEVVSGDEEARLSFTGAVRGLPPARYLVIDLGGGSTEFVAGSSAAATQGSDPNGTVQAAISVDIGCVRLTERHLHGDPPTPAQVAAATADIEAGVAKAQAVVGDATGATVVGLAGTVTTVAALALGLTEYQADRIHHSRISTVDVARISAELLAMSARQRLALPVMHPGRADVIGAGALILRIILDRLGAGGLVVSEHDILDGIAWSLR
jgi:exopolyphosphatase/guanosine-5'-triphosphate,3'-diphosphate pyrophosphatase